MAIVAPVVAYAQLTVPQGGTGQTSFTAGYIPYGGSSSLRLDREAAFFYTPSLNRLTMDNASTTALTATTICLSGDTCRTTWPSGGSSNWSIIPGGLRTSTTTDFAQAAYFVASSTTGTTTFNGDLIANGKAQIRIGNNPTRPLVSTSTRTITVGSGKNYATIQEAIDQIPHILLHQYRINVDPGTYAEDLLIGPITGIRVSTGGNESIPLQITGSSTNPSAVKVNSAFFQGLNGDFFGISGFELQGNNPYDNETSAISVYGSREVALSNIKFAGGGRGLTCYNSACMIENTVDFGTGVLTTGMVAKRHGTIAMDQGYSVNAIGTVNGYAYEAQGGWIAFNGDSSTLTGSTGLVADSNGQVYDAENRINYTTKSFLPSASFGIGTTTPDASVHVVSNTGTTTLRLTEITGTDSQWELRSHNTNPASGFTIWGGIVGSETTPFAILANGNVGISSTTPGFTLGVAGTLGITGQATFDNASSSALTANRLFSTFANLTYASTTGVSATDLYSTNLNLLGALRDGASATGTLGMVLQTTGTSTRWVATSSLGISGATALSALTDTNISGPATGDLLSYDGTDWVNVTTSTLAIALGDTTGTLGATRGGTGLTSYSTGDIIYASGANTLANRTIGTTGQVLTVSGGVPTWTSTSTLGLGNGTFLGLTDTPSSYTANRLIFTNSGATALTDSANLTFNGTQLAVNGDIRSGYFVATSTTGTSTFAGRVGIGTETPTLGSLVVSDNDVTGGNAITAITGTNSGLYVDATNAYIDIDKSAANRSAAIRTRVNGAIGWYVGTSDSDNAGDGTEFYIGRNIGGTSPALWIETNGNVGIGTTTPGSQLTVTGTSTFAGRIINTGAQTLTTGNAVCYLAGGEYIFSGGTTCVTSSERWKQDIGNLDNEAWKELLKMDVKDFNYKPEYADNVRDAGGKRLGVIAEEVEQIDPRLVQYGADGKPLTVHFDGLITLLIQAVQEQQKQLEEKTGNAKKTATDNYQWIVIGLLALVIFRQQWQLRKLLK